MLGETIPEQFEILLDGQVVVSAPVAVLGATYESALESALRTDPELMVAD
jgi:hypothetical protein